MRFIKLSALAVFAFAFFAASATAVSAATLYFNFDLGSGGTGTESDPYGAETAASNISGGDTVYVQGTADAQFTLTSITGTAGTPTTITQWVGQTAATFGSSGLYLDGSDYVTVSGVSFGGTGSPSTGLTVKGSDNFTGSDLTFTNNTSQAVLIGDTSLNGSISDTTISGQVEEAIFIGQPGGGGWSSGANTGWTFDNITVDGTGTSTADCIRNTTSSTAMTVSNSNLSNCGGDGIEINSNDVTIQGTTISSNTSNGIILSSTPDGTTLTGNTIYSNTANGISAPGVVTNTTVNGNVIYDHTDLNAANGTAMLFFGPATTTNNIVYGNKNGIVYQSQIAAIDGAVIRNNTVYNNTSYTLAFVEVSGNLTNFTFENNSVTTGTDGAIYSWIAGDGPTWTSLDYNHYQLVGDSAVVEATSTTLALWQTATGQDANAITGDPSFTSVTSGSEDFEPASGSILIDAADPTSTLPTDDQSGLTRPYGETGVRDIGALEAQDPSTTNVSTAVTATYDATNGHTNTLVITDATNPSGTLYGITTDGGTTWLNGSGGTTTTATYTTDKTWTHIGLAASTEYSYQLRMLNAGQTTILALMTAETSTTMADLPSAPTALTVAAASTTSLDVSWTAPAGTITGYTVSYGETEAADTTTAAVTSGTSTTLTGLTAGTTYYVKVRATNATGDGAYTTAVSKATLQTPPASVTPPDQSGGTLTSTSATVSWASVAGATGYLISYGTDALGTNLGTITVNTSGEVTTAATVSATLSELTGSTTYYWKVATITSSGTGEYSSVSSFTTPASGTQYLVLTPNLVANTNVRVVDSNGDQVTQFMAFGDLKMKIKAVTGDFNNDGEMDVAVVPQGPENAGLVVRFFKLSDGTYQGQFSPYPDGFRQGGMDLVAGDFNGVGSHDLAVIPWSGDSTLRIYRFNDDFAAHLVGSRVTHPGVTGDWQLTSGDYNGDGIVDVAVAQRNARTNVQVFYYRRSTGTVSRLGWFFPYPGIHADNSGSKMATGDVDGDGDDELVFVAYTTDARPNVQIFAYTGSGLIDKSFRVTKGFKPLNGGLVASSSEYFTGPYSLDVGNINVASEEEIVLGSSDGYVRVLRYYGGSLNPVSTTNNFIAGGAVTVNVLDIGRNDGNAIFAASEDTSVVNHLQVKSGDLVHLHWFRGYGPNDTFRSQVWR